MGGADKERQAHYGNGPQHDPLHDDAGRCRGFGNLAFEHGHNGDLFVQKAPAATLDVLAQALKETYAQVDPKYGETEVKTIGTRHGEKLYETLVTREEMAKAVDMGDYYRIPCDTRDLNYDKFFTEGNEDIARIEDYHSHNTARLDVEGMKNLLLNSASSVKTSEWRKRRRARKSRVNKSLI